MYCKNCGSPMDPNAAICINCGCGKDVGTAFCPNCGQPATPGSPMCAACGSVLYNVAAPKGKSKLVAGLLGIFLGGLGVHSFYLGYTGRGIAQILLSCLGIGQIWGLVDGILILAGKFDQDAQGHPLSD